MKKKHGVQIHPTPYFPIPTHISQYPLKVYYHDS